MRQVGFAAACRIVMAKDLRLEWRTWETLSSSAMFAVIVLVILNFAFGAEAVRLFGASRVVPGVLWTVIAFAAVVVLARSMQAERLRDTIAALFLTPVDRGALFTGKMLANFVKLVLLQLVVLPVSIVLFNYSPAGGMWPLIGVLLLHSFGLCELGTLFAGVTMRLGRGEALLAVLLFPAASPLLLSAVECTRVALSGRSLEQAANWLLATAGLDLLYWIVAVLTFEYVLEE